MYQEAFPQSDNVTKMDFQVDDQVFLEPYPKKYGCSVILLSMFFFQLVNKLTVPSKPPKSDREFWEWKNTFISWLHAGIVTIWNATCMYVYSAEIWQDLVAYHNPALYSLVAFTSGYFVYDFMDLCRSSRPGDVWEVLLHHVAVTSIFVYNVMICRCLAFNTIALMVEYNSFFLHTRKLMQKHPIPFDSKLYRCAVWANIVSYVLFRFGPVFAISYGMYLWRHRVSFSYFALLALSVLVMHCINVILFGRIVKNDVFRYNQQCRLKKQQQQQQQQQQGTSLNNNVKDCGDGHTNGYVKVKAS